MRRAVLCCALALASAAGADVVEVARDGKGFHSPYLFYLPPRTRGKQISLLVAPNNTGRVDDRDEVHVRAARKELARHQPLARELGVALLVPCFPRPRKRWKVYTHALDRDVFLTRDPRLRRLDLQLIAMTGDATRRARAAGRRVRPRLLLWGFSASGMFVCRFTLIHPERVRAVAAGAPGGWPTLPVASLQGAKLRYPIGIADLKALTGRAFDLRAYRAVSLLIYQGERDANDSVRYEDGYEAADRELIMGRFGKTPRLRWGEAAAAHRSVSSRARFKLYPGVGHVIDARMRRDVQAFFRGVLAGKE